MSSGRKRVDFFSICSGELKKVGSVSWDGSSWTLQPDTPQRRELLATPIRSLAGPLVTSDQPDEFLAALSRTYRSAYFNASDVQQE